MPLPKTSIVIVSLIALFLICCNGFTTPNKTTKKLKYGDRSFSIPSSSRRRRKTTTRCYLFFAQRKAEREKLFKELQDPKKLILPYTFNNTIETVIVRHLEMKDMKTLIPMICEEFGTNEKDVEFAWSKVKKITWVVQYIYNLSNFIDVLVDRGIFPYIVRLSLFLKIQRQEDGDDSASTLIPDYNILCLEDASRRVVGMVELSRQPMDPNQNPGPIPVPMWLKESDCRKKALPPPNGRVTNLLIGEEYRGRGYSKTLMKAAEGLAKRWDLDTICLHVDPDTENGRIPQNLYQGLGYRPVVDNNNNIQQSDEDNNNNDTVEDFSWMSNTNFQSGIYMVEEVPLLFMRRKLS